MNGITVGGRTTKISRKRKMWIVAVSAIVIMSVILAAVPASKIHVLITDSNYVMIFIDGKIVEALLAGGGQTITFNVRAGSHEVLLVVQTDSPGSSWSMSESVTVLPFSSETVIFDASAVKWT